MRLSTNTGLWDVSRCWKDGERAGTCVSFIFHPSIKRNDTRRRFGGVRPTGGARDGTRWVCPQRTVQAQAVSPKTVVSRADRKGAFDPEKTQDADWWTGGDSNSVPHAATVRCDVPGIRLVMISPDS